MLDGNGYLTDIMLRVVIRHARKHVIMSLSLSGLLTLQYVSVKFTNKAFNRQN